MEVELWACCIELSYSARTMVLGSGDRVRCSGLRTREAVSDVRSYFKLGDLNNRT